MTTDPRETCCTAGLYAFREMSDVLFLLVLLQRGEIFAEASGSGGEDAEAKRGKRAAGLRGQGVS